MFENNISKKVQKNITEIKMFQKMFPVCETQIDSFTLFTLLSNKRKSIISTLEYFFFALTTKK
jgi:hypothetical protein